MRNRLLFALTLIPIALVTGLLLVTVQAKSAAPTPAGDAPPLSRVVVDQAAYPDALCNDGTAPVFYYRPGSNNNRDRWLVYLKGGGSCWDADSCIGRGGSLVGSDYWMQPEFDTLEPDEGANGIFNPNPAVNPDFSDWNHVYMVYCTSDYWQGYNTVEITPTVDWHFNGRPVLDAMFNSLMDSTVITHNHFLSATHIILAGESAGNNGVRGNWDRLRPMLSYADVRGLSDTALFPTVTASGQITLEQILQTRWQAWAPLVDASCAAAHPDDPWACLHGYNLTAEEHLDGNWTDLFYHQDQLDNLGLSEQLLDPNDPADAAAVDQFGDEIRALLTQADGAFSGRNGRHTLITNGTFLTDEIDGVTALQAFTNWYFGIPGAPTNLIADPGCHDVYLSFHGDGVLNGTFYDDEDVVRLDSCSLETALFWDGSAVGLDDGADVDALFFFGNYLLLSFAADTVVPGIAAPVPPEDFVAYNQVTGVFLPAFDGSDVGLDSADENLVALSVTGGGNVLMSTSGPYAIPAASSCGGVPLAGTSADLLRYTPGSWGPVTTGCFDPYFEGADVGLTTADEAIWAVHSDAVSGALTLSTRWSAETDTIAAVGADLFVCEPLSFEPTTACAYAPFISGNVYGNLNLSIDGVALAAQPAAAPVGLDAYLGSRSQQ